MSPAAPKTLEQFTITARDWIDRDGGDNPELTYEFTAAEADTVSFVGDQCVRQPETGYAERVLSSRSEVTQVDRVLPAGSWDIIVRVFDQLGAVSIVYSEGVRKWLDPQHGLRSARDCGRGEYGRWPSRTRVSRSSSAWSRPRSLRRCVSAARRRSPTPTRRPASTTSHLSRPRSTTRLSRA